MAGRRPEAVGRKRTDLPRAGIVAEPPGGGNRPPPASPRRRRTSRLRPTASGWSGRDGTDPDGDDTGARDDGGRPHVEPRRARVPNKERSRRSAGRQDAARAATGARAPPEDGSAPSCPRPRLRAPHPGDASWHGERPVTVTPPRRPPRPPARAPPRDGCRASTPRQPGPNARRPWHRTCPCASPDSRLRSRRSFSSPSPSRSPCSGRRRSTRWSARPVPDSPGRRRSCAISAIRAAAGSRGGSRRCSSSRPRP